MVNTISQRENHSTMTKTKPQVGYFSTKCYFLPQINLAFKKNMLFFPTSLIRT